MTPCDQLLQYYQHQHIGCCEDYFDLNGGNLLSGLAVNLSASLRKFDAKEA